MAFLFLFLAELSETVYTTATMATDELLAQLRKIVREEVEAEGKKAQQAQAGTSLRLQGKLNQLEDSMKDLVISTGRLEKGQQELTRKIETVEMKVEAVNQRAKRIEQTLDKEVTDIAETQHKILVRLNQLDDHESRIGQLEEDSQFLPHSH
jgi:DNA repair ATPase RecN